MNYVPVGTQVLLVRDAADSWQSISTVYHVLCTYWYSSLLIHDAAHAWLSLSTVDHELCTCWYSGSAGT